MTALPSSSGEASALRAAKRPRSIIAGPYGHPFHAIAVTIPIGAWSASIVFDVTAFFADDAAAWASGARMLIIVGLVGAGGAAILGFLDYARLAHGTPAQRTAHLHMVLNLAAMLMFGIGLIVRFTDPDGIPVVAFLLSLLAMGGLSVSGWLGGKLAYRWGVRVADETTQAEGFRAP
jgi:uncharacterized membrane protein